MPRSCQGGTRLAAAVALLAVLTAAGLPLATAVICEGYRTPADCKGKVTDSGYCGWTNGACHAVKPLPEGVFAIASVEDEDGPISSAPSKPAAAAAAPAPAPAPQTEGEELALAAFPAQPACRLALHPGSVKTGLVPVRLPAPPPSVPGAAMLPALKVQARTAGTHCKPS